MSLTRLEIQNFRCIEHGSLELDTRCNVIYGDNAAGKTSILEAIFLLGCGRSFRTNRIEPLIQTGKSDFVVIGHLHGSHESVLGFGASAQGKEIRLNGIPVRSLADLALALPVQAIDPEVHKLVEEGPARRRRYVDWGVFHVEPVFRSAWKRYQRAITQRNAALRTHQFRQVEAWNQEIIESGTVVALCRERYVESLRPVVKEFGLALLGEKIQIEHSQGWRTQVDLSTALTESRERDNLRGSTTVGPHHADLIVSVTGFRAKDRVSRGQQKMLAAALLLAQQAHRAAAGAPPACLLMDDPAAELDVDNLGKLLQLVASIPAQLVVTSLDPHVLGSGFPARLFHVKRGHVAMVA